MHEEHDKIDSHPARYFSVRFGQAGNEQMPLRLPAIHLDGHMLCCDTVKLELRGLLLSIMTEFIARRGRLPHTVLLQLVKRSLTTGSDGLGREVSRAMTRLRSLCESNFASTHPQLCWLPNRGSSSVWLLLHLKESYVLTHTHERGRVANLFHRHEFHYEPMM